MEEITSGSAECTVIRRNNEEIHTIIWTVPRVLQLLKNGNIKTRSTSKTITPNISETTQKTFQLKIEAHSFGSNLYIYYRSPTSVLLKSVESKNFTFDLRSWTYSEVEETIFKREHQVLHAGGGWQALGRLMNYKGNVDDLIGLDINKRENILYLLNDGNLQLKVEFVVTIKDTKVSCNIPEFQLKKEYEEIDEDIYSDALMKSADGKEFKVHKAVLASRCSVLKAHFDHKTTESITNIVKSPLEYAVLREVLSFIYTDTAPKVDEMPEQLLAAADFYQLNQLKSICEDALIKKLTVDNAVEILQLADSYSANTLKEVTLNFIKRDEKQRKLICKTEGFAKLKSVDLIKMIFE